MTLSDKLLVYAITDRRWLDGMSLYEAVKRALEAGISIIQIREKDLKDEDFLAEATKIVDLCKSYGALSIINDNVEVARKSQASGIHIGQDDADLKTIRENFPDDFIIGVTVHNKDQAIKAYKNGADYLGCGAIFPTGSKSDADLMTIDTLREITASVEIPVVAIGGINKTNIKDLKETGIDGISVISAIFKEDDITAASKDLISLSKKYLRRSK